jgi:carbamate kinase
MRWKLLNADPPVTYGVALQTGDDVLSSLGKFIREREIEAASVTAIGAFSDAQLGYFDWQTKAYKKIPVTEQVEVLSLLGDVAVAEDGPTLHLHADARGHFHSDAELHAQTPRSRNWPRSIGPQSSVIAPVSGTIAGLSEASP